MKKFLQNLAIVAAVMLSFATNAQVSTFPYTCGFEDASENAEWTLTNGSETCKWYIGTAANNGGSNGLYISSDNGTSNTYVSTASKVMAYRQLSLTAGTVYSLSFDWRCNGESTYDIARVFLVPASTSLSAGTSYKLSAPTGDVINEPKFNLNSSWTQWSKEGIVVPTTGNYKLVFYWENDGSVNNDPPVAIDNIVFSAPTCPVPLNLAVSNITSSSADFSWTADASQSMWDVMISESPITNFDAASGNEISVSTNPYTFTGLTAETPYYAYVRADCGSDGTSIWAGPISFRTGFDCTDGDYAVATTGSTSTTTGSFIYASYGSSYSQVILTPHELNDMGFFAGNIRNFKLRYSGTSSYAKNLAIYMGNTTHPAVFASAGASEMVPQSQLHLVYTNTAATNNTGWVTYALDTAFYWDGASNLCVAILCNHNATSGNLSTSSSTGWSVYGTTATNRILNNYGDNVIITPGSVAANNYTRSSIMPDMSFEGCVTLPSCFNPNQLTVTNIIADSAIVSWNQRGSASSWNVAISDTVVTDFDNLTFTTTYDDYYVFEGLSSVTQYYVYVQADCGGDVSEWSQVSFMSACGYIENLPYRENFNNWGAGTTVMPVCWSRLGSTADRPYIHATSSYDRTGTGYALYFYAANASGYCYGIMPPTSLQIDNLQVGFWSRQYSSSYNCSIVVGVMDDPTDVSTFVPLDTVHPAGLTYEYFEVPLSNYQGTGEYIAFSSIISSGSSNYMLIDDVELDYIPTCVRPGNVYATAVASDEISLAWTERGDATSWIVEYSDTVFDPTSTDAIFETEFVSMDPEVTLTSLQPNTTYYVYVAADCGGETSAFAPFTIRTACDPIDTLPYAYGFEDATAASSSGLINTCWTKGTNYSTAYPYPSSTNHSGTRSLYFYASTSNYCYAAMPAFEEELSNLILTFWNKSSSTSYTGQVIVGVMDNPNDISTFTAVQTCTPNGTTWTEQTVGFGNYNGTGRYIAFYVPQGTTNYVYLDDITVDMAPSCPAVTDVAVNNVSYTSARVSWNYIHGIVDEIPDDYTLVVKEDGTVVNTISNAVSPVQLSGLNHGTAYTVVISSSCSGTEGGADSVTFSTTSLPCVRGDYDTVTITGTTAATDYHAPVSNYYRYTYTQQLILASEVDTFTSFAGIAFDYGYTSPTTSKTNVTIYMGNTTNNTLSTSAPVPFSALTPVYTGPLNCQQGWNYFMFDNAFVSNGSNVVIAVDDNSNAYDGSSYVWNGHSATNMAMYYNSDSENPDPANPPSMTMLSFRPNMKLIAGSCLEYASCLAPTVVLDSMEATSATVSWAAGLDESSWDVEYRQATDASWTTVASGTALNSIDLVGLNPNTTYQVRVGSVCTDTVIYATISFTTPCMAQSVPFSENFNTWTASSTAAIDACWKRGTNYSTTSFYPYVSSSYGPAMYMYSTSTSYSYLALPFLEAPVDSLQVAFQLYRTNTTYAHKLDVGVMTDPTDFSTFTHVAWANPTLLSQWENFEINFDSYAGTGRYIAFVSPNGEYSYPYLDNIVVDYIPSCPRPTNVTASNITGNSALIAWNHQAEEFEVEFGPAGFAQGQGTVVSVYQQDTVTITGLNHSTPYEVYVRALCDNNDTGAWSFPTRFATLCSTIDNLPYTENFNNWGAGTTVIPNCWHKLGSTADRPYINTSTTYDLNGSGFALYFYAASDGYCYGIMPPTSHQVDSLQVGFWARQYSTSYDCSVVVGVMTDPTDQTTFVALDTVHPATTTYEYYEIPLSNYQDTGKYIAFSSILHSGTYIYMLIDNVELDYIPTCARPENLVATNGTTTTADLSWSIGDAAEWEIQIDTIGGNFADATSQVVSAVPFTVTNLTPGSQYQYRVRAICGIDDTSRWSRETCIFGTALNPAAVPYSYDFETDAEYASWRSNSSSTVVWTRGAAGQSPLDTTGSYGMFATGNGTDATLVSGINNVTLWRDFDFGTDTAGYLLEFDASMGGNPDGAYHGLMVCVVDPATATVVSTAALTTPWGYANDVPVRPLLVDRSDFDTIGQWRHFEANLDNMAGIKRIGFYMFTQTSSFEGEMAKFDNVAISQVMCERPSNLVCDTIGSNYAELSWSGDAVSEYEITWRQYPRGTNVVVSTIGNHYTLTGLEAGTRYAYWVRRICNVGDTSDMSNGLSFYTECGTINTLPWSENFDNVTTNASTATGEMPNCWTVAHQDVTMSTSNAPQLYYTTSAGYNTSGRYSLRLYYRGILALPEMGHAVDSLMMTFNVRQTSSVYGLIVGVLDSVTPGCDASFTPIDTILCNGTSDLEPQTIYFANYTGTGRYIAFRNYYTTSTTTSYSYNYIDDIVVDWMPTCFPVLNVHADANAATTNSVTIDWTDMGGNTAPEYEIAYNTSDFTPGTGVGNSIVVTSHPAVVPGLIPATTYQLYVRPICSAGDTARWSAAASAQTGCDIIPVSIDNPYIQNFNAITATTYSTAGQLPACWDAYSNGTNANYFPHVVGSSTYWYSPDNTHSLCLTSGGTDYGSTKYVRLPELSGEVSDLTIHFWYKNESTSYGDLEVGYFTSADLTSSFTSLRSISRNTTGATDSVSFANAPATARYIGFKYTHTSSFYSVCIDDVVVTSTGTGSGCHTPADLNATVNNVTANLSWTADTTVELSYKVSADAMWSVPIIVNANNYTLTYLQPETNYDWRIRCICDTDTYSTYAMGNFTTGVRPCYTPENLQGSNITASATTLACTLDNHAVNPLYWIIGLSNGTTETFDTIDFNGFTTTLTGLTANTNYSVRVQGQCATNDFSSWSESVQFATIECVVPTGIQVSNTTMTTADVSWTAGTATAWQVSVCEVGMTPDNGVITDAAQPSLTLTNLNPNHDFVLYVRTVCGEGWYSNWSEGTSFRTRNIEFTITTAVNDPAMGTVTGGGTYEANTSITLTATANAGYHFVRWQEDGSTQNPYTIVVDADYTYTAVFASDNQGIDDVNADATMAIYPNPTSTNATISLAGIEGKVNITIVDMSGRKVVTETVDCAGDCIKTFNVANLAQGAYFVRIESEGFNTVKKLVVK